MVEGDYTNWVMLVMVPSLGPVMLNGSDPTQLRGKASSQWASSPLLRPCGSLLGSFPQTIQATSVGGISMS